MAINKINIDGNEYNLASSVEITYAELKALRDNSQLAVGTTYIITNYQCTTTQENTASANHQFDIIVVADRPDTLNENARARLHKGDTYFDECKLEAWELKYCLDNDKSRFIWADEENGKGVIYYMKDEHNNECPYDFKNIMFIRTISFDEENSCYFYDTESDWNNWLYTFTAINIDDDTIYDASVIAEQEQIEDSRIFCYGNIIKHYNPKFGGKEYTVLTLNDNVFINSFSIIEQYYFECSNNTFGDSCKNNTFSDNCKNNIFGNNCDDNTFGSYCNYNILNDGCYNNKLNGASNLIGKNCNNIIIGASSNGNIIGDFSDSITIGESCEHNVFGASCSEIELNTWCYNNQFGNSCINIKLDEECVYNVFKLECSEITLASGTSYNTFDVYCNDIKLGDYCCYNSFSNDCNAIIFGNNYNLIKITNTIGSVDFRDNIFIGNEHIVNVTKDQSGIVIAYKYDSVDQTYYYRYDDENQRWTMI